MTVVLNSNIAALRAAGWLTRHTAELGDVYERLSSGQRINHASDDAAGLSLATKLNADRRVYTQGMRNINDGISLVNIAESAINELESIVLRIQELAEQAANGTATSAQRNVLDEEAQTLADEYARIIGSTEFNSMEMFDGTFSQLKIQAGYGTEGEIPIAIAELENGFGEGVGGYITVGDGTFDAAVGYTNMLTSTSSALAVGDLNGDGADDIVTVCGHNYSDPGIVQIRLGVGDGTFGAMRSYDSMEFGAAGSVRLGDLNGDGRLDIVTSGERGSGGGGAIELRLGNGNGTFGAALSYTTTESVTGITMALSDLNGDGRLDVVTGGHNGPDGSGGGVTVRLGNGNGTFGAAISFNTDEDEFVYILRTGDLNGDGDLDLVTGGRSGSDGLISSISVMLGNGNGTFAAAVGYDTAGTFLSEDLALGDLDGDNDLDIVVADAGISGGIVSVFLGNGNGTFGAVRSYETLDLDHSQAVALGDVDGDGILDVVTGGSTGPDGSGGSVTVMLGNGDGSFAASSSHDTPDVMFVEALVLSDLNDDGSLDIVTGGQDGSPNGKASVLLGNTQSVWDAGSDFNLRTQGAALSALGLMQDVLTELASRRGTLGAYQSRLQHAFNHLSSTTINLADAESRIMDADIANDVAQLLRLQVLQQATTAVLGQANTQPALALKLLQK